MSIIDQNKKLERKANAYDQLVDRVAELSKFIDDWDSEDPDRLPRNHKAKIAPVRTLVDIYRNDSTAFKREVVDKGYYQDVPIKYRDSLYDGKPIIWVKVNLNGDVFIKNETGEHFVHNIDGEDFNVYNSIDYTLCEIQDVPLLEIRK